MRAYRRTLAARTSSDCDALMTFLASCERFVTAIVGCTKLFSCNAMRCLTSAACIVAAAAVVVAVAAAAAKNVGFFSNFFFALVTVGEGSGFLEATGTQHAQRCWCLKQLHCTRRLR